MPWTEEEKEQHRQRMQDEYTRIAAELNAEKAREWATIPPEVLEVHNALTENARQVYTDPEDFEAIAPVYTYPEDYWEGAERKYTGAWVTGGNREDGRPVMVWEDGVWFYHSTRSGHRRPMEGGHDEAMSNASIFWTG